MSFDPNPMGPMMHQKQIEREVQQHRRYERTAVEPKRQENRQPMRFKSWIARIANIFAVPRTSS